MAQKKADELIESTIETLEAGSDSVTPKDGASLIKDWLTTLKKDEAFSDVADNLEQLQEQLKEKEPDVKAVQSLLKKLSDQTAKAAKDADDDQQDSLKDLADTLKEFGKDLK